MKKNVLLLLITVALLCVACGKKNDNKKDEKNQEPLTPTVQGGNPNDGIEDNNDDFENDNTEFEIEILDPTQYEDDEFTPQDRASNYINTIWIDCFSVIKNYVEGEKKIDGNEYNEEDIDKALLCLKAYYEARPKYDAYFDKLDKNENQEFLEVWNSQKSEMDKLYNKVVTEKPRKNDKSYKFDCNLYSENMAKLIDIAMKSYGPMKQ
ncbi:MAG: hypothetical protein PUB67_06465 [Clostridiales bacterium]|nr:hypothetical protein [Clostridiales bacterium]